MMEKEPDSMATVQMKADYAASEVYSTSSEAPPVSQNGKGTLKRTFFIVNNYTAGLMQ